MRRAILAAFVAAGALGADSLGFVQLKFSDLHFERDKWTRVAQAPCYTYTAKVDGATVDVLRAGMGNLVPFKAKRNSSVSVCGSVAAFDEGFQAGLPVGGKAAPN